jgi:hypothetical protein
LSWNGTLISAATGLASFLASSSALDAAAPRVAVTVSCASATPAHPDSSMLPRASTAEAGQALV